MKTVDLWLAEYGESHQHRGNKLLHWICVPIIVVSLVGLLWSLPFPGSMSERAPLLNWGSLFLIGSVLYYFMLSTSLALGMSVFVVLTIAAVLALDRLPGALWIACVALFVVAWVGQFIGHHFEGKRPSFFKDIQFLMIGPLWLLSALYRKLRIPF